MKLRRLTPLAALGMAALAGCAAGAGLPSFSSSSTSDSTPLGEAERAQAHNDNYRAARAYEQAAIQASGAQAYDYHLRAAEAAVDGNDYSYASGILDALPLTALDAEQQLRWRLQRGRIALARNDAAGALHLLPADNGGSSPEAERVLLLRGRALFRLGDPVGATQALVQREHLLPPGQAGDNHDTIWSGLNAGPLDSAALNRAGSADPVSRGWIELANLSRRNASLDQYEAWRQRYPGHPAQDRLPGVMMQGQAAPAYVQPSGPSPLQQPFSTVTARPGFYALLLPQSGALAPYAEALRSGFAAAAQRAGDAPDLKVYDAAGNAEATLAAYNQAVGEGAGVVIGPLLRNDVAGLSQAGALRTPVLALNYLDAGHAVPPGFYQFGLAPEDEARAAAEDAVARGLRRALLLVPDNERGRRVQAAFEQRLGELGGEVRDSRRYSGEFKDWQAPIASLLRYQRIDDKKKLAELRAANPGVDPQRRHDFDFIFMDAGAAQARQLWPLFRFYHAERMAIYDTAAVNEGHGDTDLSGIRFCDAPWMLDNGGTWTALHGEALNGRRTDLARFYALGDDAFQLALRLSQNSLKPLDELPGASGTLRVGDDGAVHRGLVCARTTEGEPQVLESPGVAAQ